jgi:hypothetical protein
MWRSLQRDEAIGSEDQLLLRLTQEGLLALDDDFLVESGGRGKPEGERTHPASGIANSRRIIEHLGRVLGPVLHISAANFAASAHVRLWPMVLKKSLVVIGES